MTRTRAYLTMCAVVSLWIRFPFRASAEVQDEINGRNKQALEDIQRELDTMEKILIGSVGLHGVSLVGARRAVEKAIKP